MTRGQSPTELLRITRHRWSALIIELARRGRGERESGAFLLAHAATPKATRRHHEDVSVRRIVYYDDLDAACLTGGISLAGRGYDQLWQICRQDRLRVVADVHTHPGGWTGQSAIDAASPMMAHPGHVALIVAHFATRPTPPDAVGVHLYRGRHQWEHLRDGAGLTVTRFDRPALGRLGRDVLSGVQGLRGRTGTRNGRPSTPAGSRP